MKNAIFALSALFLMTLTVFAEEEPRTFPQDKAELRERLDERISIELSENNTFEDLFKMITKQIPLQIKMDPKGAGALGITISSPVVREHVKLVDLKLKNILRQIFAEQDLTFVCDDEILLITSEDESKKFQTVQIYPVADLVRLKSGDGLKTENYLSNLMDAIEATVRPDSWDEGGEMIEYGNDLLVVRQSDAVHAELEKFLDDLRSKLDEVKPTTTAPSRPTQHHAAPKRKGLLRR